VALLPDDHRVLYQAFLDQATQDASLTPWLAKLPEQLASGLDRQRHGDLSAWEKAVAKLPPLPEERRVDLNSDTLTVDIDLTDSQQRQCFNLLRKLAPWRKGPFNLGGIEIDTEWRSSTARCWMWAVAAATTPGGWQAQAQLSCW